MSTYHLRSPHLKLIATSHVRHSLRGGAGVIFLILAMLLGVILASIAIVPIEELQKRSSDKSAAAAFDKAVSDFGPDVLSTFMDATPAQTKHLLRDEPALASLFLILFMVFLPFLTTLSSFNQTSGDIGSKGLRYLLLRTERPNLFLGRMIGTYLFTLVVIAVIMALVGGYLMIKVRFYPTADVGLWMLRGFLACAIFALPWVAVCAWISASMEIPFVSLIIVELGLTIWIVVVASMQKNVEAAKYAAYLTPWGFKWWLLDANIGKFLAGTAAMLGFTGLFTFLGLRTFEKRDL